MRLQFRTDRQGARRPGRIGALVVIALPTLTLILALALNAGTLNEVRTFLHTAADSSALAAAQGLVDDRCLMGGNERLLAVLEDARSAAHEYVARNPVPGGPTPVRLLDNPHNHPHGDIVFGALDTPRDRKLLTQPLGSPDADAFLPRINTVRVTTCRTKQRGNQASLLLTPGLALTSADITTSATATLDPFVVGFRATGRHLIPLAPVALYSDPGAQNEHCWEHQVERKHGGDGFCFKKGRDGRHAIERGGDSLHEMAVTLSPSGSASNACLLQLGTHGTAGLAQQIAEGVSERHLRDAGLDCEFVLRPDRHDGVHKLVLPGTLCAPERDDGGHLQTALEQLQSHGEPRVWPLFSQLHDSTHQPVITGFVAARVAHVTRADNGTLSFVLQPCKMSTATAVTEPSRQGLAGNRYICRVRLVD